MIHVLRKEKACMIYTSKIVFKFGWIGSVYFNGGFVMDYDMQGKIISYICFVLLHNQK
jgi:hypothetical protein